MVCRTVATAVIQSSDKPWRTKNAGPSRNSPLPMADPSTITPGPTTRSQPRPVGVGGSGSSARPHGSRPERVSTGAESVERVTAIAAGPIGSASIPALPYVNSARPGGAAARDREIAADLLGRFRRNADDADVVLDTDFRTERFRIFLNLLENFTRLLWCGRQRNICPRQRPW